MKCKRQKQAFLTIFLLASLSLSLLAFFIPKAEAQVTTLATTELIDAYGITTSQINTFLGLLQDQNISRFTFRIRSMYQWDDSPPTMTDINKAKTVITAANALGIDVAIDLHTWYTTWDQKFDDDASSHAANRVTYINYVEDTLTSFASSNVYAFMVLNEPQAQTASSDENQFIVDVINAAHGITSKPISVRFMGGHSPSSSPQDYATAIDTASDFWCRNYFWDPRYPTVSVYQVSQSRITSDIAAVHATGKELWITECGWHKPESSSWTSANLENQRAYAEAMVGWCNDHDVDLMSLWVSQPTATSNAENYNLFTSGSWTPHSAFYELVNEAEGEPPLGDNVVTLNQPNNLESLDYFNILFNYTATFYQGSIVNSSLWANVTGTWQRLGWNTTAITNATMHTISYTFAVETTYIWNVQVFNSTTAHWAAANRTLTIETTPPPDNPPTYGTYSVSSTTAGAEAIFQLSWWDDVSLVYGWLGHNSSGIWVNETVVPMFTPHLTFSDIITLPSSAGVIVGFRFYANDTAGQWNVTSIHTFRTSAPPPPSTQKTIIWAIDTDIVADIVTFASWCNENYFNTVNVMGTGISTDNILYLHGEGLTVYKNVFPIPSCFPNYTYSTSYDLEEQMIAIATGYLEYDGIVMDDSHNAWRYAHNSSMFETDYVYYQWLIDNATEYLTPIFGADNVNLIMYIGGDECNFTKMPLVNCTSLTFSYYYPPDPLFQYYGPEADIDGDWWLGIFKNTTANAWDIKSYYDTYGLNEYYAYEGWMWLPNGDQYPKTETFIKTYNAIVELSKSYTVHNLNIGFHWTLYNNTEVTKIMRHLCQNWLDNPTHMDEDAVYIYDWDAYYWTETFDTLPSNETSETYLGWQYLTNRENYTWNVDDGSFWLNYTGSNNATGGAFSLERMFTTERDLNISCDFTPSHESLEKYVIIREGYVTAQHYVYHFDFNAFTRQLRFVYRIAKAIYPNNDVCVDIGTWTVDCTYHINFQVRLSNATVSISNSTWSWSYTIPDDVMYYNTIKIGYLSFASSIGIIAEINVNSFKVDNIQCEPLIARNPPFEFENYIGYYNDLFHNYIFLENGLMVDFGRYDSTFDVLSAYAVDATLLIIDYQGYILNFVTGDIFNYTISEATKQLNVTLRSSSITHVYIDWASVPDNVDVEITDMEGCGNWVFSQTKYYTFQATFWDADGYTDLSECSVAFTDGLHWVNMTYSLTTSIYRLDNGTDVVNLGSGSLSIIDANEIQITFPIYFQATILDANNVSIYMRCIDLSGASDGWELVEANYFNIYNLGGHSTLETVGDAGRLVGGDIFDLYCGNMSSVEATIMFRDLQHVKMLPTFQTFGSNYGLNNVTFFMEYCVGDVWVRPFSMVLTPGLAYIGGNVVWWNWTATYYELGVEVKTEKFWCYYQNYNATQSTLDAQLFIDLWFNRMDTSTVWGARVNAYYYPMTDASSMWLRWLTGSNWGVDERVSKQSECFGKLRDNDGNAMSLSNVKLVRVGCNMTAGNIWAEEPLPIPFIAKLQHFNVFDFTFGSDPLEGVQTPPWDETKIPTMAQGGLLGSVWTALQNLGGIIGIELRNALWNAFAPSISIAAGILGAIFSYVGLPNPFPELVAWLQNGWFWMAASLSYCLTLLTAFFAFLAVFMVQLIAFISEAFQWWGTTFTVMGSFLAGGYGTGVNIWTTYNIPQWITLGLILYPIYLVFLWEEEGLGAVIDQITFIYNTLHLMLYVLLTVIDYVSSMITRLFELIPIVE